MHARDYFWSTRELINCLPCRLLGAIIPSRLIMMIPVIVLVAGVALIRVASVVNCCRWIRRRAACGNTLDLLPKMATSSRRTRRKEQESNVRCAQGE